MNQLALLLLLAFCRDTGVRGFRLLPSAVWSRSAPLPPCSSTRCDSTRRTTTTMSSFWQGMGKGQQSTGAKEKCPVLICPAQLSIPGDYTQMVADLKDRYPHDPAPDLAVSLLHVPCKTRQLTWTLKDNNQIVAFLNVQLASSSTPAPNPSDQVPARNVPLLSSAGLSSRSFFDRFVQCSVAMAGSSP